jgi:hypothetical protein
MLWIKNTLQMLFALKPGSTNEPFDVIAQFGVVHAYVDQKLLKSNKITSFNR